MKPLVLVTSYYHPAATAAALERLAPCATIRRLNPGRRLTEDELLAALAGVSVAIVSDEPFTSRVLASAPQLRLICCDGVGVDHIDIPAATRHGILVANAPVVHESNGDFTFALILALVRKLLIADRGVRAGQWNDRARFLSRDVCGCTLGLLGFGRVARAVARRARGFDMTVLACSRRPDAAAARDLAVTLASFDDLLSRSDILSIHVTLTDQTRGLIGQPQIARMKPGAYLVNTSRGAVLDESALVQALRSGHLAGAALDVFHDEPPPPDHPLLAMDNVVLTPHVGSDTTGTFARVFDCCVDDILLFLQGRAPAHIVNPQVLQPAERDHHAP